MQPPFHIALSGTYVAEVCDAVGFLDFLQKPEVTKTKIVVVQKKTEEAKANVTDHIINQSSVFPVNKQKGAHSWSCFPKRQPMPGIAPTNRYVKQTGESFDTNFTEQKTLSLAQNQRRVLTHSIVNPHNQRRLDEITRDYGINNKKQANKKASVPSIANWEMLPIFDIHYRLKVAQYNFE